MAISYEDQLRETHLRQVKEEWSQPHQHYDYDNRGDESH